MDSKTKLICTALFLLLCMAIPTSAATNLLDNADFEMPMVANFIPGWVVFTGRIGEHMVLASDLAYDGQSALVFHITDKDQRIGLRSSPILAVPQQVYEASVMVYDTTNTRVTLYLDFWDSSKKRIAHKIVTTTIKNAWEEIKVRLTAPEDALFVSVILYSTSGNLGTAYFDHAALYLVNE